MMGPHSADSCYLRGSNFRPTELEQRLNLYNKQNGSKLPPGKEPVPWNPRSLNPTHKHTSNSKNTNGKYNSPRPFDNYSKKNNSKSISFLSTEEPQQQHDMSAMISDQLHLIDTIDNQDHENYFQDNVISIFEVQEETSTNFSPSIASNDLFENRQYGDPDHNYQPLSSLPTEVRFVNYNTQHIAYDYNDQKHPISNQPSDYNWDEVSFTALPDHKNHYTINDSDPKLPFHSPRYFTDAMDILNERWYSHYNAAPHIEVHLDTASSSIASIDDQSTNVSIPASIDSTQYKQGHVFISDDTNILVPFASHIDPTLEPSNDHQQQQQFNWPNINAMHSSNDPTTSLIRQSRIAPKSEPYNMNELYDSDICFDHIYTNQIVYND